jgi:hypothetical protein
VQDTEPGWGPGSVPPVGWASGESEGAGAERTAAGVYGVQTPGRGGGGTGGQAHGRDVFSPGRNVHLSLPISGHNDAGALDERLVVAYLDLMVGLCLDIQFRSTSLERVRQNFRLLNHLASLPFTWLFL